MFCRCSSSVFVGTDYITVLDKRRMSMVLLNECCGTQR